MLPAGACESAPQTNAKANAPATTSASDTSERLASVVASLFPAHAGRLDRLAVDYARAGLRVSSEVNPHPLAQRPVHPFPGAVEAPSSEVVVDGLPRREVVGQKPPGAAAFDDVEDGVKDLA